MRGLGRCTVPKIRVQSAEEVERSYASPGRRAVREEERHPYREAVRQLDTDKIGGILVIKTKLVSQRCLCETPLRPSSGDRAHAIRESQKPSQNQRSKTALSS